jgi:FolB domain-containing protein
MGKDTIHVEDLVVECIVGILPEERTRPQPLHVDVTLHLALDLAARTGRLADTVDYARVADEIQALLEFRNYQLLERAVEELCAMILGVHPEVSAVDLRLRKPRGLTGRARSVGVAVHRARADFPRRREAPAYGAVEILLETSEAGLYLLHVDPGQAIPPHHHLVMRELEWLVEGQVLRDGVALAASAPLAPQVWPRGQIHTYENAATMRATLFCCDVPAFIRSDEIVVDRESAQEPA